MLYFRKPEEWDSFSNLERLNGVEHGGGGGGIMETVGLRIPVLKNCLLPFARKELQELNSHLSAINAILVDAEKKAIHSLQVRNWLDRLKDVLHDAEDLLGELHAETLKWSVMSGNTIMIKVRNVLSSPTQLVYSLTMRQHIRKILKSLSKIASEKRFVLERIEETSELFRHGRESHSFVRNEEVIGREKDKEKIVNWLCDVDSKEDVVPVLPIVGMGGVGKTTLAQLVYNDEMVSQHFAIKIWLYVGDNFDIKQIMLNILERIGDFNRQNLEMEVLVKQFRKRILGTRYLLVLDDLWSEDGQKWLTLKDLLTSSGREGSRVIITTRSEVVAMITGTKHPYSLCVLDEEASLSLFKHMVFRDGDGANDSEVTAIAKRVWRKCGGNPLAIRIIGSILYSRNPQEWDSFLDKELPEVLQGQSAGIMEALKLSYNNLPSLLKKCFAYCGLFPKGYEIDVRTLVSLWISQGFIRPSNYGSDRNDLEYYSYEYFVALLQRSFFQEPKIDERGKITKCKMQNLMHDLAISLTEARCITFQQKTAEKKCSRKTHHVSFDFHLDSPWQIPTDLVEAKKVRTIILTRQSQWEIKGISGDSICDVIASKFKFLRTLDLHNSGIKVVPNLIGELKLLQYLDLSQNKDIKALPKSFGGLQNLHTLKLNDCGKLQELPRKIRKLINLRHLEIDSCYSLTHMPRALGQLTNLQTLSEFVLSRGHTSASRRAGELDELAKLNKLRGQLRIKNLKPGKNASILRRDGGVDTDVAAEVLKQKTHIQSVMLIWDTAAAAPDNDAANAASDYKISLDSLEPSSTLEELSISAYGGIMFSEWLSSHENLVKLSLSKCMNCKHLPLLNRLTKLKVLVVDEMASLEYISDNIDNSPTAVYPSLKELRLTNLPKLDRWWKVTTGVEEMIFPCLSKLIIEDCPCLNSMPLFPHLEELLVLKNTRWEPFQHTIRRQQIPNRATAGEASSQNSSTNLNVYHPLSKLRTLCIIHMSNGDKDMWQHLLSLRSLTLDYLSNVETLLERLPNLTSLQELCISRCDGLSQITPWISDLKSLSKLTVRLCPNLTIPLDQIGHIISLQYVQIEDCPELVHIENLLKHRVLRR